MVCFWGSPRPRLAGGFLFFRYKEQRLAAGMDDYCVKPVQAKNLLQTMAEVLQKKTGDKSCFWPFRALSRLII